MTAVLQRRDARAAAARRADGARVGQPRPRHRPPAVRRAAGRRRPACPGQVDADPDAIAAQVEEEAEQAERTDVAPSLSPDAKAALLAAYEESRELGASYVGPEHVLLALARDDGVARPGELLQRFGISHTKLRGAVIRGVEAGGAPRETLARRRRSTSTAAI